MLKHFVNLPIHFYKEPSFIIIEIVLFSFVCYGQKDLRPFGFTAEIQALKHRSFSVDFGQMWYTNKEGLLSYWTLGIDIMPKDKTLENSIYGIKWSSGEPYFRFRYLFLGYDFMIQTNFKSADITFLPQIGFYYKHIALVLS